jgi:predicted CopG family antitoxin
MFEMARVETALNSVYTYTHIGKKMVSKTISITEEVYNLLSKMKLEGESFSDAITRLIRSGGRLSECAGLWKDMSIGELEEIKAGIGEARRSADERLRKVAIS